MTPAQSEPYVAIVGPRRVQRDNRTAINHPCVGADAGWRMNEPGATVVRDARDDVADDGWVFAEDHQPRV